MLDNGVLSMCCTGRMCFTPTPPHSPSWPRPRREATEPREFSRAPSIPTLCATTKPPNDVLSNLDPFALIILRPSPPSEFEVEFRPTIEARFPTKRPLTLWQ